MARARRGAIREHVQTTVGTSGSLGKMIPQGVFTCLWDKQHHANCERSPRREAGCLGGVDLITRHESARPGSSGRWLVGSRWAGMPSHWEDVAWSAVGLVTPVAAGGEDLRGPAHRFVLVSLHTAAPRHCDWSGTKRPQREPRSLGSCLLLHQELVLGTGTGLYSQTLT